MPYSLESFGWLAGKLVQNAQTNSREKTKFIDIRFPYSTKQKEHIKIRLPSVLFRWFEEILQGVQTQAMPS